MIDPAKVSAIIVTRGDKPLAPIKYPLIFDDIVVWDNSVRDGDAMVYGRFLAMREARNEVCLTLDDDVIIPAETQRAMCDRYEDGTLLTNMSADRHGQPWAWWGWGAMVQRELPELAFRHWERTIDDRDVVPAARESEWFKRLGCDIVAGTLIPHRKVALPHTHAEYAHDRDRLYASPGYEEAKARFAAAAQATAPMPLKLNLGCGVHRLDGFVNLDLETGWTWEGGLPYDDGTVAAISVSHSLMYVSLSDWPFVFAEMARVLEPYGVLRVTEDNTTHPASERLGGHPDAVTMTYPAFLLEHMREAGFNARPVRATATGWMDDSLIQRWHGDPPKVFHAEAVKPA